MPDTSHGNIDQLGELDRRLVSDSGEQIFPGSEMLVRRARTDRETLGDPFPPEQAAQAHEMIAQRGVRGRPVIVF